MEIREYTTYREEEILPLYEAVGWTAYTDHPSVLARGFANSLLTLGAYEDEKLIGLVRTVGDGCTVVLVQDLLVFPSHQRQGVGTALLREVLNRFSQVRQIQLATDNTPKTLAFLQIPGVLGDVRAGLPGIYERLICTYSEKEQRTWRAIGLKKRKAS